MQWQLQGSPPKKVCTRLITRVLAELAPALAAVALAVVEDSSSQLYVLAGGISPCSNRGRSSHICSGDFRAVRPRGFAHASTRVLLAEPAPVLAAVALAVVEDFLRPALRARRKHLSLQQ